MSLHIRRLFRRSGDVPVSFPRVSMDDVTFHYPVDQGYVHAAVGVVCVLDAVTQRKLETDNV